MIFSRLRGLRYAHTPLESVAHCPEEMDVHTWSRSWENHFNLGLGEPLAEEIESQIPLIHTRRANRLFLRSNRIYAVPHCHKITDLHPEGWNAISTEIRQKYHSSPKPVLPEKLDHTIRIAVHLRRGDVSEAGPFSERFTSSESLVFLLQKLLRSLEGMMVDLHLFSQGAPDDFASFANLGATLHLDEDPLKSFHWMAEADILFTAKSTFSYLAGMIGGGLVCYEPFWHPPLPGWINHEEFARVDREKVRSLLSR